MKITPTHVYFFTEKDFLSNFYPAPFNHQDIQFRSSEQAVMYRKAMLFGAKGIAGQILQAQTPKQAKALGRSKSIPFNNDIWDSLKEKIYFEVLIDKFTTPALSKLLQETGTRRLVEASPYDKIWGCGLAATDPRIQYENSWPGQNLLGNVLERVRKEVTA